ncbi:hypothetical protein RclHR1_02170014 [Rhizophagus clarus]|uniref:F-box domain-containing protein n=1 Tax=Rhizophagus clarus TaxID=94130 RepID=A0A2Z6QSN7_9GLOM|nr:hypothetical protein RclHR1_02170014 [Rhizophagus clarus]GES94211.1 hypothetical protein GLOIN_2v1878750 [Rhizophagus clarus]
MMLEVNEDILYLIFEELKDDGNTLFSCLLVNKNWFYVIIPILWKNPWKYLKKNLVLLKVIISHLSEESRNNIEKQNILVLTTSYKKPLFKYLSFCKHLNFETIFNMMNSIFSYDTRHIIVNEIINFFINENMKFTHLSIPERLCYKIHFTPEFKNCFSELEFLQCDLDTSNQNILEGLANICKSIKNLKFKSFDSDVEIDRMVKLVESQKELNNICYSIHRSHNESFYKPLEESLIKHMNTIQYLKIDKESSAKLLLHFVNLISLEILASSDAAYWKQLEDVYLPHLKFLRVKKILSNCLAKLIENTKGNLIEISIYKLSFDDFDQQKLIQAIAQNCPNLKYLTLMFRNNDINIDKLEELLINCQFLSGLNIVIHKNESGFNWNKLFKILTKSSPIGLFKFKFYFNYNNSFFQLESLGLFFDEWKGRHPMLLQTDYIYNMYLKKYVDLIEIYKAKGIVKKYENIDRDAYEEFEWIEKKFV